MKRVICIALALCLLLSGCSSWLDSSYQSVTPHEGHVGQVNTENVSVTNYSQLYSTLRNMVQSGTTQGVLTIARYDQKQIEEDLAKAVQEVIATDPVAAYAVSDIRYELGTNGGQSAVAVNISYLHSLSELRKILPVKDMAEIQTAMADVLNSCGSGVVLYVDVFKSMDFEQWVSDYAAKNPDLVMEVPVVTANIYPETGKARVVELRFTYQNSRESLRQMQGKVNILFDAATIYAGDDGDEAEQFFKLYSFLMGLFQNYQLDASLTPAYSLLQNGVGDSKAFATVYAAMCEKVGLDCIVVTGMKAGQVRYWNIVCVEGVYYHVDLLDCDENDEFIMHTDAEMVDGYVWDYQAYPACGAEVTE